MLKKNNNLAVQLKGKLLWFVLLFIVGIFPTALLLAGFGVLYAIEQQWLLILLGVSLASVGLVWLASRLWLWRLGKRVPKLARAEPLGHWRSFEQTVWQAQQPLIDQLVAETWQELPSASLAMIQNIAKHYQKNSELAFSLPEALRLTEEVSRRYRQVLLAHVPYVEQAKLSYIKTGIDNKDALKTGFKTYKYTYNLYRAYRTINPLAALVGEARNLILSQVGKKLLAETDHLLKTALLEEIARTAIDLYSGRFQIEDSQPSQQPPSAITVTVVGQVSAGKSSLINALCEQVNAEVQRLPSTSDVSSYDCHIDPDMRLTLVDLPGLDASDKRATQQLNAALNSDLVIWVLKANQPARQLDCQLKQQIDDYYRQPEHCHKLAPLQLAVLNQVDLLPGTDMSQDVNEQAVVQQAVTYNQGLMAMPVIPTCLSDGAVNLNSVLASIELLYQQALNIQLNRQRHQGARLQPLRVQAQRATTLGRNLFKRR